MGLEYEHFGAFLMAVAVVCFAGCLLGMFASELIDKIMDWMEKK